MNALALERRWRRLASRYSPDGDTIEVAWRQIATRHGEAHRHYHTLDHLIALLGDLDAAGVDSEAAAFAVFYHDMVYQTGSRRNEAASAAMARRMMKRLEVPETIADRASYLILCTREHTNPRQDTVARSFLDADMSVLGRSPDEYSAYCASVRREFAAIPEALYRRGRQRFLQQTLDRPVIYQSAYFYAMYEHQARLNIKLEMSALA